MFYVCHCFPMTKLIHSPATHVSRNLHARVTQSQKQKQKKTLQRTSRHHYNHEDNAQLWIS